MFQDCKASRPRRNDFVQYSMIARYDSAHTVKERSKHAPLPKQLKYIDDQKNGTPRKGSELVEEALKSYGKELPEKKQSQKARRYNNGKKIIILTKLFKKNAHFMLCFY